MTRQYKDYIYNLALYMQRRFNLTEYNLKLNFANEDHDSVTLARVGYNLSYLYINIEVYPCLYELYQKGDYTQIVSTIVHEFCHHFVEPLSQRLVPFTSPAQEKDLEEIVELCTQRITRVLIAELPPELFNPKQFATRIKRTRPPKNP